MAIRDPRSGLAVSALCGWLVLAAGLSGQIYEADSPDFDRRDPERTPRVALFRADGFPTVDADEVSDEDLESALLQVKQIYQLAELPV